MHVLRAKLNSRVGRPQILTGMGGTGKTTIGLELAKRGIAQGMDVWWISASDADSLNNGMRALAVQLGATEQRVVTAWSQLGDAPDLVWGLLNQHPRPWILVVDNADDTSLLSPLDEPPADGRGWIRQSNGAGIVLVATRDQNREYWGQWCDIHTVNCLDGGSGAEVLQDLLGRNKCDGAESLAAKLGGLPLALNLVGKYLNHAPLWPDPGRPRTCTDYLKWLDNDQIDDPHDPEATGQGEWRNLIAATWEMSLTQIAAQGSPVARDVFGILATLANAPIPYAVLLQSGVVSPNLPTPVSDADVRTAIAKLNDFGLIHISAPPTGTEAPEDYLAGIHPLIRETAIASFRKAKTLVDNVETAALLIERATQRLDPDQPRNWPAWQRLTPHVHHLATVAAELGTDCRNGASRILKSETRCLRYLLASAQTDHASQVAIDRGRRLMHLLPLDDAASMRFQAEDAYVHIDRLDIAEPKLDQLRTLHACNRFPTAEDREASLQVETYFAVAEGQKGNWCFAAERLRAIIDDQSRTPTLNPRNLLWTRFNYCRALMHSSSTADAVDQLELLIKDVRRSFGTNYVLDMGARHLLAQLHNESGNFDQARRIFDNLLADRRRVFGERNSHTIFTYVGLGGVCIQQGRLAEAERLLDKALRSQRQVLTRNHPDTFETRYQLGRVYQQRGETTRAQSHLAQLIGDLRTVYGDLHVDTMRAKRQLATIGGAHAPCS